MAIWYPSLAAPQTRHMGTFSQQVASNGAIDGAGLPLVLISHGTGGYQYSHHDTALAMANAGFIVLALTHPGDNYADQSEAIDILARPRHIVTVLDYMLKEWPHRERIAPSRIGLFGFSSGGFTALVSVGGQPDLGRVPTHCAQHRADYACKLISRHGEPVTTVTTAATADMHERRIRAAVIAAPALGFTFDAAALSKVTIPIQLWRAHSDEIVPHPWYAEQVRASLPRPPEYHVVAHAGHFDFLAPCTEKLATVAPQICASEKGFDRADFHQRFNAELIGFFQKFL
jgi:predicted dienelactone hydrolase